MIPVFLSQGGRRALAIAGFLFCVGFSYGLIRGLSGSDGSHLTPLTPTDNGGTAPADPIAESRGFDGASPTVPTPEDPIGDRSPVELYTEMGEEDQAEPGRSNGETAPRSRNETSIYYLGVSHGRVGVFVGPPRYGVIHHVTGVEVEHLPEMEQGRLKNGIPIGGHEEMLRTLESYIQ